MFGAVVTVAVQHVTAADAVAVTAVVFQFAAVAAVVLYAAAAAEPAVAVSAVAMFVIDALVVYDVAVAVAVVVAGPQALLTTFVRGHCFVVD